MWLQASAPLADNDWRAGMPAKYLANVAAWTARYGPRAVQVHNGKACLEAVKAAEAASGIPGLTETYLAFAGRGMWVLCADVARVAILYNLGGTYLDTDMCVRCLVVVRLPVAALLVVLACVQLLPVPAACRVLGSVGFPRGVLCDPTVCWFPQDDDGVVQNNFISAPRGHKFLHWLLRVFAQHAPREREVIEATGPLVITTLLHVIGQLDDGPMHVQLLPPERFYPEHWYAVATPADRTADMCFAVHTWDRTWCASGYYYYPYYAGASGGGLDEKDMTIAELLARHRATIASRLAGLTDRLTAHMTGKSEAAPAPAAAAAAAANKK